MPSITEEQIIVWVTILVFFFVLFLSFGRGGRNA